jgi:hypothetical protein
MPSNPRLTRELERSRSELADLERRQEELLELEARRSKASPLRRYWDDPVGFARDCIVWPEGKFLTDEQQATMRNLAEHERECVRAPHGVGKTADKAILILWFALTRDGLDWKIITTASSWHQLSAYLWPEVHKWAKMLDWQAIGRPPFREHQELLDLSLKLSTGSATAASPDRKELIEGAHADHLLFIFDEAKAIPDDIFDAAEGAFATGHCYGIASSTPGEPVGRFYDIQKKKRGTEDWHATHITMQQAIASGRMDPSWAEKRRQQWGESSALYINRVLGDFASSDEDSVIPLSWIEAANARWQVWRDTGAEDPFTCVGVDVARGGADSTVLALRRGVVISELRETHGADTMVTTGSVLGVLRANGGYAVVDVIGVGAGVVDRLREQTPAVVAFNASERSEARDSSGELGFVNKRSAAWWAMREFLDPANDSQIALPPDDELPSDVDGILTGDLCAPHWTTTSSGLIKVESKEDIKKRLGRSTDYADAVIQAFYTPPPTERQVLYVWEDEGGGISPV